MEHFSSFYRKNGILKVEGLKKFPIKKLSDIQLPLNSVIHNWTFDAELVGLTFEDPILVNHKDNVIATFVKDYTNSIEPYGSPIRVKVSTNTIIDTYYNKNQHIVKYILGVEDPKNQNLVAVYNYNLIETQYKYTIQRFDTHVCRWLNRYTTLLDTLIAATDKSIDKQHFVKIDIPVNLPQPSSLKTLSEHLVKFKKRWKPSDFKRDLIDDFRSDSLLTLVDLWLWAGPNPEISHFSKIPYSKLQKINFIFSLGSNIAIVNMGLFQSWIKRKVPVPGLTKYDGSISPIEARKRLLHFLLTLTKTISLSAEEIIEMNSIIDNGEDDTSSVADANISIDTKNINKNKVNINVKEVDQALTKKPILNTNLLKIERVDNELTANKSVVIPIGEDESLELDDHDSAVDLDLQQLEFIAAERKADTISGDGYKAYVSKPLLPETTMEDMAKDLAKKGLLSAAELRRATTLANKYREIPSPFNNSKTIAEDMVIDPESLKIGVLTPLAEKIDGVTDKSMLSSSLKIFDNKYISETLKKDLMSVVLSAQKVGVAVTEWQINAHEDINDRLNEHVIKLVPLQGKPSVLRFTLSELEETGEFIASGTQYRMRKQWGDLPIRKVSPETVALTSYLSKMFVKRSDRATFNYDKWITNQIVQRGISSEDSTVLDMSVNNVFTKEQLVPRTYGAISKRISKFRIADVIYYFDYNSITKLFTTEEINNGGNNRLPVGRTDGGGVVYMDDRSNLHYPDGTISDIEERLGLDPSKIPLEVAEMEIFKKKIPIGIILGQYIGLGNLLETVGVEHRRVKRGNGYKLTKDEFTVAFEDEVLIFSRKDNIAKLLFNGFNRYKKDISRYSVYLFDKPEVYGTVLDDNGINVSFIREFNFMRKMWIDPITESELRLMGEPTDFVLLLLSAVNKLANDKHSDPMDIREMRVKGYERIPGIVYEKIAKACRSYASKTRSQFASVDLNPYDVWNTILKDESVIGIEESNPIHSLKEQEIVVFRGSGGRSAQSMNAEARTYHRSGMGVISETNPDNGDVGTINYLSADPNFENIRGISRNLDTTDGNSAKVISTTMLTYAGSDRDD